MRTDRQRHRSHQPELPLDAVPATIAADRAFDWQLDEQTCRVGRVGVAAARARLQSPSGRSTEAPTPPGGGRRAGPSAPARAEEVPAVEAA